VADPCPVSETAGSVSRLAPALNHEANPPVPLNRESCFCVILNRVFQRLDPRRAALGPAGAAGVCWINQPGAAGGARSVLPMPRGRFKTAFKATPSPRTQGGERRQGFEPSLLRRRRFFGLLGPVPCLRDHTPAQPAPQGRPPEAEIRRSRLWSLKSVLDVLRVPAARPGTRHFRAEHVAGKARSGGPPGLEGPPRPFKPPGLLDPRPDSKTF
jgi:hypothetical protein